MAHTSPAVNLVWSILSIALGSFLVFHLWSFDRFKCLRWNHGPYSGAFKRVMTYSYILSIPLLIIYSLGFAIIKYSYGFTFIPGYGILPTPFQFWSQADQRAIVPLYLCVSFAWGLEMVSHLEELCFWLFVVNSGSSNRDWFRSVYFKIWVIGSCIAVLYMPLIAIFTRHDLYKCEALTFLSGGLGSFILTIWFLPVLWAFPGFIEGLKQHDLDMNTLVRLTKFHELNCVRVVFRFLFTIPLIILGVDGVRPHVHINDKMFPTDLLAMVAGVGCVLSSAITLIIFFPRSIEGEITAKEQARSRRLQSQAATSVRWLHSRMQSDDALSHISITKTAANSYSQAPVRQQSHDLPGYEAAMGVDDVNLHGDGHGHGHVQHAHGFGNGALNGVDLRVPSRSMQKLMTEEADLETMYPSMIMQPNRRNRDGDVELGMIVSLPEAQERARKVGNVNQMVHNWRSPIDFD